MVAIYFFGTGICCMLVGVSESFETLAISLLGVGVFAAIYRPVGTPMVVDAAVVPDRHGVQRHLREHRRVDRERLHRRDRGLARLALFVFIPAAVFIISGFAYLAFVPDDRGKRCTGPGSGCGAEQGADHAVVVMFCCWRSGSASSSTRSPSCCPS